MWKVLIADDEPKIRQGLKNTLESFALPLTVCAEAKNGLEALEKAKKWEPDILLVDICMPKLGGIAFLEEIKKLELECKMVIISGFNEFSYAKQAILLGVSCYLLKPIADKELYETMKKLIEELEESRKNRRFLNLMQQQIQQNGIQLREVFLNDWLEGSLSREQFLEQMELLEITMPDPILVVLVSAQPGSEGTAPDGAVSEELRGMTLKKMVYDLLKEYGPIGIFVNRYQDIVVVMNCQLQETEALRSQLQAGMEKLINGRCCIQIGSCHAQEASRIYEEMKTQARKVLECRPIVQEARKYIFAHYGERDLDLTQVADAIGCNSSYLSRTMKQELGISFKDFLTMRRISQAIHLMRYNDLSLNQIAEKVGYSNQHYFSAAFKNCQGVSPSEFRRNLTQE